MIKHFIFSAMNINCALTETQLNMNDSKQTKHNDSTSSLIASAEKGKLISLEAREEEIKNQT